MLYEVITLKNGEFDAAIARYQGRISAEISPVATAVPPPSPAHAVAPAPQQAAPPAGTAGAGQSDVDLEKLVLAYLSAGEA